MDSKIIETSDIFFLKVGCAFSEIHPGHPHENIIFTEAKPPKSFCNKMCS